MNMALATVIVQRLTIKDKLKAVVSANVSLIGGDEKALDRKQRICRSR